MFTRGFRPAITWARATSTVRNAKAFSANTPRAWPMVWSNTIPGREGCSRVALESFRRSHRFTERSPLQFLDRLLDVGKGYVACEAGDPNFWRDHKPDFSAFKFLVVFQCTENFAAREIFRQPGRQIKSPQ